MPSDMMMELRCIALAPHLRFVSERYGEAALWRIMTETGMNIDYLRDENNWVSHDYTCRFLDKVVEVTGDSRATYEAARLYSDRKTYKALGVLLSRLGTPRLMYGLIAKFSNLWSRSSKWHVLRSGKTSCTIRVLYPRHKQARNNCLAIQGSFAAVPKQFFDLPFAEVTEKECACDGAEACVYEIKWVNGISVFLGLTAALAGMLPGLVLAVSLGVTFEVVAVTAAMAVLGYIAGSNVDCSSRLKKAYRQNEEQAASLMESLRNIEKLNDDLQNRVQQRTEELVRSNAELGKAMKDLKATQEKVLIAEKQSAIGVLAAGMAHEINSPLNAIRLAVQSLREDIGENARLQEQLAIADRASNRCKRIVNDLLSYSREPRQETDVKLDEIVAASVALFEKEHPAGVTVGRKIAANLPALCLDRMQIQQVVLNLLKNASDAMDEKGEIMVSLDREEGCLVLRVADRGPGISEADRKRIFDPFFTTKKTGKGMGLGLSITYQLVNRNGGSIEVSSSEGAGAAFTVRFPVDLGKDDKS